MIKFRDDCHYVTVAFVAIPSVDWLAVAWQDPDGKSYIVYRHRNQVDDKIWDSKDTKSWYELVLERKSDEELHSFVTEMAVTAAAIGQRVFGQVQVADVILVNGGPDAVVRALKTCKWAHVKELPRE